MGRFRIGAERVGIVTDVQQLDGDDKPIVTAAGEPVTGESVVWWDGCTVEMQDVDEAQGLTISTSEMTVVIGPAAGNQIPTVDDDGDPAPMAVADLTANQRLRHDGRTYVMRGDAVLQKDIRGRSDHVECKCEHQAG